MPTRPPTHKTPWHRPRAEADRIRKRLFNRHRPSSEDRGYDKAWRILRARYLSANPTCVICGRRATEVDHIKSVRNRPDLRLDWYNLRAICKPDHSRRTATEQGFARKGDAPGRFKKRPA